MNTILALLLAFVLGGFVGIGIMCLLQINKEDEEWMQ